MPVPDPTELTAAEWASALAMQARIEALSPEDRLILAGELIADDPSENYALAEVIAMFAVDDLMQQREGIA